MLFGMSLSEKALSVFVALLMFGIMILGLTDVVARYLFGHPIPGASEIAEISLAVMVFSAIPLVTAKKGHVTIDIIPQNRSNYLGKARIAFTFLMSAGAVLLMMWQLGRRAVGFASFGDTSSYLNIPLAPIAWFMSFMSLPTALILIWQAIETFLPSKGIKRRR